MDYTNRRSGLPYQSRLTSLAVRPTWTVVDLPGKSIQLILHPVDGAVCLSFDNGTNYHTVASSDLLVLNVRASQFWVAADTTTCDVELTVSHEGPQSL